MTGAGLTATELAAALAELAPILAAATVRDAARLEGRDDLLLFLDLAEGGRALHLVPGGPRARVTLTRRRFRKQEFRTDPLTTRLAGRLRGCSIRVAPAVPGERRCGFDLTAADGGALHLQVELFGARGLWCLTDHDGRILELSRLPDSAGRELRPGAIYRPPAPRGDRPAEPAARFAPPCLPAIDEHFTRVDQEHDASRLQQRLRSALDRAIQRLQHKIDGLGRQQDEAARIDELRHRADLLLAYGFGAPAGARELAVPDPDDPNATVTLPLTPGIPVQQQADRLYKKARKLADGAAIGAERRAQAERELAPIADCRQRLEQAGGLDELTALRDRAIELGLLPAAAPSRPPPPAARDRQLQKAAKGYNFRRFASCEGYPILVGRTNQENDRLSVAVARGNDLWFHVGQGYAGSHVVIRLPKGKTASLESMLDAGTLAIHFSKARGAERCEVIYTPAKNVRKPKGLPPGRVTTANTRTLLVRHQPERLRRLLDSSEV